MKKGFTLIELLVTVSIVGLIASVALANLQNARQKAREGAGRQFHTTIRSGLGDKVVSRWELDNDLVTFSNRGGEPEPSTPDVIDASGSNLNGYSAGGVETLPDGIAGNAASFDGTGYLWGTNFPNPGLNSDFTVSTWIKPDNIAGQHIIFSVQDNGTGQCSEPLEVGISGGKGFVNGVETTGYVLVNNVWQNLVFTFRNDPTDGQVVDTYINGEKINTTPGVNTPNCPNGVWSIGASITYNGTTVTDHTNGFVGLIDSLNVFNGSF
jgi:prepilin-type N-terminal cleavage/methylation domain-containing protein